MQNVGFPVISDTSGESVAVRGKHYYYGNLKALCDHWDKDAIGVSYSYLKNLNILGDKPFQNDKCVIRRGIIVTSAKKANFVKQKDS